MTMLDRQWTYFWVNGVWAPGAYSKAPPILDGWGTRICVLPRPILCAERFPDIVDISLDGALGRVYPPFELNESASASALFAEVEIPAGKEGADQTCSIPVSAFRGLTNQPSHGSEQFHARGMRLDMQKSFPIDAFLTGLLDHVTIHTYQWWLRSAHDPFSGPTRMAGPIDDVFQFADLRTRGPDEIRSGWFAANATQSLTGIELGITPTIWRKCIANVGAKTPAEMGLVFFVDAIGSFMGNDDQKCILNLALSFEVLANKRHYVDKGTYLSKNKDLLEATNLVDDKNKSVLRKLITDRDNVAHGRPPHWLSKDDVTMQQYVDSCMEVIKAYLKNLGDDEWPSMSRMSLSRGRRDRP